MQTPAPAAAAARQNLAKLPYDKLLLRFHAPAVEAAFSKPWNLRRSEYDRNTLLVCLCVMGFSAGVQIILRLFYNRGLAADEADEGCPAVIFSSWVGGLGHLFVRLTMGAAYLKHRTPVVAAFRIYSAITTGVLLPRCAVASLSDSNENPVSAAMVRTGIISTWFQAGGFPVPFRLEVPLLAAQVGFHMATLSPALCADPSFWGPGTDGRKSMAWVGLAGGWLQSFVYGTVGFAGKLAGPSPSCLHLVRFLQAVVAFVVPLFAHYCWECRSRFWWWCCDQQQWERQGREQHGNAAACNAELPDSEPELHLPPTMVEATVALTAGAVAWVLLGLL